LSQVADCGLQGFGTHCANASSSGAILSHFPKGQVGAFGWGLREIGLGDGADRPPTRQYVDIAHCGRERDD